MEEHSKRRRKKTSYKKINNETRQKLIDMVFVVNQQVSSSNYLLKDAAKILDINYSTAKTIVRIFRLENRKEKKNAEEERLMKSLLHKIRKEKDDILSILSEEKEIESESINQSESLSREKTQ